MRYLGSLIELRVVMGAKHYGVIPTDNGADWFIAGAPDDRWDNDVLRELNTVTARAFEAVDESSQIIDRHTTGPGGGP